MTNDEIFKILHEVGHAVPELKHFKKYDHLDLPPYSNTMTCLDSVMSNEETCPPTIKEKIKVLDGQTINICDPSPAVQKKVAAVYAATPNRIGDVDIAAAKNFNKSWNERNNKKAKEVASSPKKTSTAKTAPQKISLEQHAELIRVSPTLGGFTTFINSAIDRISEEVRDVVESCPSYFPQTGTNSSYWSSGPTFFAQSATTVEQPPVINMTPKPPIT
jgi:hypothetical protein